MAFTGTAVGATKLQAARVAKGWTQDRTLYTLQRQAQADGVPIARSQKSLKTMLSRWENGGEVRSPEYRSLFCKIYDATEADLGFNEESRSPLGLLRVAPAVDIATVAYFRNVFAEHLRADNLMGPHHLVDVVQAQAVLLDQVLPNARGDVRQELLVLACRYNEFAGWLYQDAGQPSQAMAQTDRAMDYALEIGDPSEAGYVLMRKAHIACDTDRPDRAVGLSDAALRDTGKVAPQIRAMAFAQRGRALAKLGEADECARTLEPVPEPELILAACLGW